MSTPFDISQHDTGTLLDKLFACPLVETVMLQRASVQVIFATGYGEPVNVPVMRRHVTAQVGQIMPDMQAAVRTAFVETCKRLHERGSAIAKAMRDLMPVVDTEITVLGEP